ncbi:MAG: flagellar hook-associated protein FlgK [Bdellovibrionales bacterium]|nr:flagellar hook-associated protein FlgK [Bdellovibrionales bacterium]
MTNYSAKIFNNAVSALAAQQAIIANTANNIANVNTEGYSRRVVNLEARVGLGQSPGGFSVGNGVSVDGLTRISDEFLNGIAREANSETNFYEVQRDFLARVEPLFSLTEDVNSVGSAMTQFFDSLENLSLNPASVELRSDVLERAQDLVDSIQTTYGTIASLQSEAEARLASEIDSVNQIATEISTLNGLIAGREANGSVAADERDRRDRLLEQLAEKISFDSVEGSDGSLTISLANGFPLVNGNSTRTLELTGAPSFIGGTVPPKLDGSTMQFIVFDYDPAAGSSAHLDLTQALANGQGTIGGLLAVRGVATSTDTTPFQASGALPELAGRIESIARDLLTRFNETYRGPEATADPTANFDPSAVDLNGNNPALFGFFNAGSVTINDADADGIPDNTDLDALITAGTVTSYASLLSVAIGTPEEIAAGRDATNGTTISPGNAENLLATDGLITLKTATTTFSSDASNGFQRVGVSYNQLYNETVGRVGNLKARAETNFSVSEDNLLTARNKRDEISGVSLDEEFTSLIRFQKAFEANARILRSAQELLDTIVGLI